MAKVAVHGISCAKPPNLRMSRVPVSWSTMPAVMNSAALKLAWFKMWKIAATAASGEPSPIRKVIKPRWLMVEYASKPFRSCLKSATKAANAKVMRPVVMTMPMNSSVPPITGVRRASRNRPALTMVAECR